MTVSYARRVSLRTDTIRVSRCAHCRDPVLLSRLPTLVWRGLWELRASCQQRRSPGRATPRAIACRRKVRGLSAESFVLRVDRQCSPPRRTCWRLRSRALMIPVRSRRRWPFGWTARSRGQSFLPPSRAFREIPHFPLAPNQSNAMTEINKMPRRSDNGEHWLRRHSPEARGDVCASINYMKAMAQRPARYLCTPPPGMPELNWELESHPVQVYNGRPRLSSLSIETQGFTLRRAATAMTNFYDHEQVRHTYYPEVERLVREVTGAHHVLAFDDNVRNGSKAERQQNRRVSPCPLCACRLHSEVRTATRARLAPRTRGGARAHATVCLRQRVATDLRTSAE